MKNCMELLCDLNLFGRYDNNEKMWLYGSLGIMTANA